MRHSGRRTRSPKFTGHCPGSGRPLGSINQTQCYGIRCNGILVSAQRRTRCNRLHRAVLCCNGRHTAATGRHALQPVALRCCGTRDRCCEHVVCAASSSRQQVAPGLWSVAAGCGQLQHGTALQQIALACITVVVRFSQQVQLRHSKLHCVATGISTCRTVAMRCNEWSVDLFCNRIVRCCNMRCAVATDCALVQQFCVVALSAVATPDALLQRMSNCFGCVVARTC